MNLIRQIKLPNGRSTSNLGFGCAGLMRTPTAGGRERLLRSAFDAGVTHFDVARMYGDGLAEGFVGSALKPVRDEVTIATKFGLPYVQASGSGGLKSLAKFFVHQTGLKSTIQKMMSKSASSSGAAQPEFTPNRYTVAGMEESLATSLAQLQTDHVDLFFVHEPGLHDVIADDLAAGLAQKKVSGQVGAYGISAGRAEAELLLDKRTEICGEAVQHFYNVFNPREPEPIYHFYSGVFGVFGTAFATLEKYFANNPAAEKTWSDKLNIDLHQLENRGVVVLAVALALHPSGMVFFSTTKPKRLRNTVRKLMDNSFTEETLRQFRKAVIQGAHAN